MKVLFDTFHELDYYDGPIMFCAKTDTGMWVFGVWVEEKDDGTRTFFVIGLSERQLQAVVNNCCTYHEMQRSQRVRGRYLWDLSDNSNELIPISLETAFAKHYLSERGCRGTNANNPNDGWWKRAAGGGYGFFKRNNTQGRHKTKLKRFRWRYKHPWPGSLCGPFRKFMSFKQQRVAKQRLSF